MLTSTEMIYLLVSGLLQATILTLFAFVLRRYTRSILAFVLVVAAAAYVFFATLAGESPFWLLVEVGGVAIYGALALLGVRRSAWWLAAGWALHPVWDIPLHYFGPGHTFAPASYAIACLSFDLLVAGAIAGGILLGWRQVTNQPVAPTALPTFSTK